MAGQILVRCICLIRKWQPVGINLQHLSSTPLGTRQHNSCNINKELAVTSTWFPWQPVNFAMLGQLYISPVCYQNLIDHEQINIFNQYIVGVSNHAPHQCSSVLKKRRQKMNHHKYKKLRKKMKFLRRKLKK